MEGGQGSGNDVQQLLVAIKSAEVVESRIQLLTALGDIALLGQSDLASVHECLIALWEDFTCLDVSQCTLNNTILHVAVNCLEVETEACRKFCLILGAKACAWCGKHLKMTLISTGESQDEEHSEIFFQLLLELLKFTASCFSIMVTKPISIDKMLWDSIENFTLKQLDLLRDLIAEIKSISSLGSELLKVSHQVLEAATKACKVYAEGVDWDSFDANPESAENSLISEDVAHLKYVRNVMKCTIEKLCILGTLAANGGGSLVSILNSSWKGVVSLLQLGKGRLADNINIGGIIKSLISLATESLQCGAQAWSTLGETVSIGEAKRVFLPIKFFLINAVRISSRYPCQAVLVHREIAMCILVASTFAVLLSQDAALRNVAEALEEHLKPSVIHLLNLLLNSAELDEKLKFEIIDHLFCAEKDAIPESTDEIIAFPVALLEKALSMTSEDLPRTRILLLGRVALFIDVMKASPELEENSIRGICRKLQWLLDLVADEMVYGSILVLQLPASSRNGKNSTTLWQPMHSNLLHALKIFMIVASSSPFWNELEFFLLENFLHPHFLCHEIVMELWSFMGRHTDEGLVNKMLDKLYSLYQFVRSSDSCLSPDCTPRKLARSICMLLSCSKPALADRFYSSIVAEERPHLSALMWAAMLLEGFNLNLLSDNLRSKASEKSIMGYLQLIGRFSDASMNVVEIRVLILSSILQSLQVDVPEIDTKTLKFLLDVLCSYKDSADSSRRNQCASIISETLQIISTSKHLYKHNDMEQIILQLRGMFNSSAKDAFLLQKCKSSLALFMASLGHMEMEEREENLKSTAAWDLYHMLLRERHWALVHLVITSFGYFAARTSCNQLWRFVPKDASLSFDIESGSDPIEERFMSELKDFLQKETALTSAKSSTEEMRLTMFEGLILKELHAKSTSIDLGAVGCEILEIDLENPCSKRRKLPDGFNQGMEMLQNGLKVMGDGLSAQGQNLDELGSKISVHLSQLREMIAHLAGLAGGR